MMTTMTATHRLFVALILLVETGSVYSWLISPIASTTTTITTRPLVGQPSSCRLHLSARPEDEQDDFWGDDDLEVLQGDGDDFDDDGDDSAEDWISDAERAKSKPKSKYLTPANEVIQQEEEAKTTTTDVGAEKKSTTTSPYTEEEEDLIAAMGGKTQPKKGQETTTTSRRSSKREDGFLGDCTLYDIATDYSVPVCYLADVLCMWGVPVPIHMHDRLGDLVTGEQAFALVEAVNSLDIGDLQDRYSNQHILQLCEEWDIELKDAFEFAMKEGWSLPFGVRTNLRVEQENEILRVFSSIYRE
jgi:hypothetical protein